MRLGPLNFIIFSFMLVAGIKLGEVIISSDLTAKPSPAPVAGQAVTPPVIAEGQQGTSGDKPAVSGNAPQDIKQLAQGNGQKPVDIFHPEKQVCLTGDFLQESRDKMTALEQKEREVNDRIKVMQIAEQRVQEQLARLEAARQKVSDAAQSAESKMNSDNEKLRQMYEQMKAKDAAEIFNEMDPKVAATLLRSMKEQKSSQILAAMEPKQAYEVTLMLSMYLKQDEKKIRDVIGTPSADQNANSTPDASKNAVH